MKQTLKEEAAESAATKWNRWVDRYAFDTPRFVFEVLGILPDRWQIRVMRAYDRGERRISIRSCHGSGKTALASWLAVHQMCFKYPQKTVVTAPSAPQLFDAFFVEFKHWVNRLPKDVAALFKVKSDRVELASSPESSFLSCRTSRSDSPEALQGVHSEHVLLICDEASGIPEAVFEAASGSMSGDNACTLLIGNPVRVSGLFYDTHTRIADDWFTATVSAYDTNRVSQDFIDEMAKKYGEESNVFRVRVLGEFPLVDDDAVIPFSLVEAARNRDTEANPDASIVWGLDVARYGTDKSALCKRQRNVVLEPIKVWQQLSLMELAGRVVRIWEDTNVHERPTEIMIDSIGLGAGVVDRLLELGLPAVGVNVAELPALGDTYRNLRSELWFGTKDWLSKLDCSLPKEDRQLFEELIAPRYKYTSGGKMVVESKDEMRKRLGHSPDRADSLVLTFASQASVTSWGSSGSTRWNQPLERGIEAI